MGQQEEREKPDLESVLWLEWELELFHRLFCKVPIGGCEVPVGCSSPVGCARSPWAAHGSIEM